MILHDKTSRASQRVSDLPEVTSGNSPPQGLLLPTHVPLPWVPWVPGPRGHEQTTRQTEHNDQGEMRRKTSTVVEQNTETRTCRRGFHRTVLGVGFVPLETTFCENF